jgi:hypothetical protein
MSETIALSLTAYLSSVVSVLVAAWKVRRV